MAIFIDFETRSRTPINVGASKYSKDAEVLCLSYCIDDGDVKSWAPGEPDPADLFAAIADGKTVHAHNAAFEICIWRNVMVRKHGWPRIAETQWHCTMSECYAAALPGSLENAGLAIGTGVEKDMTGRRLMLKMAKPRRATKHDDSEWHENPEDMQRLREYCDQDVLAEKAIHKHIPRLNEKEQGVYRFDQRVNFRGVMIDRDFAEAAIEVWQKYCEHKNNEVRKRTNGEIVSCHEVSKIAAFCGLKSIAKEALAEALAGDNLTELQRFVLETRAELALSSVAKFQKMLDCAEEDDRIRGTAQYHGAQTGRWAGRLVQLQNLPRGDLPKTATDEETAAQIEECVAMVKGRDINHILKNAPLPLGPFLSSLIRSAIVAAPGKKLLVCDFASVEARGLAWAANEEWLLDTFRRGEDVYVEMAKTIYDNPNLTGKDKDERAIGKAAILGCGYGMGAAKFQGMLASAGVTQDLDFCQTVIDKYRKKNSLVRRHWYHMGDAAIAAVRSNKAQKSGPYFFKLEGRWLNLYLPSGRAIRYLDPDLIPGKYGLQIKYTGTGLTGAARDATTYSGKLVENATQALCRDLLVEAMARLEKRGYRVIAHVHDEVICEVDENFGSISEVEAIMSETPKWADGFPVGAEGFEAKRYRK